MTSIFSYWYSSSPQRVFQAFMHTINLLEGNFAVSTTARNFNKPLFQDYSREGRIIGYFLRIFRILGGLFAYAVVGIFYLFVYLLWLLFPLICLSSLIGSVFGS